MNPAEGAVACPGQRDWFWCHRCAGLWYAGSSIRGGACPVLGTGGHGIAGSGIYYLSKD